MHKDAIAIVSQFNAEIRGLYNYYSMAENVSVLNNFAFIMKGSFLKTLAAKGNTSCNKIRKKYERDGVISIPYVAKSGPKCCEFYHDGFTNLICRHAPTVCKIRQAEQPCTAAESRRL